MIGLFGILEPNLSYVYSYVCINGMEGMRTVRVLPARKVGEDSGVYIVGEVRGL